MADGKGLGRGPCCGRNQQVPDEARHLTVELVAGRAPERRRVLFVVRDEGGDAAGALGPQALVPGLDEPPRRCRGGGRPAAPRAGTCSPASRPSRRRSAPTIRPSASATIRAPSPSSSRRTTASASSGVLAAALRAAAHSSSTASTSAHAAGRTCITPAGGGSPRGRAGARGRARSTGSPARSAGVDHAVEAQQVELQPLERHVARRRRRGRPRGSRARPRGARARRRRRAAPRPGARSARAGDARRGG